MAIPGRKDRVSGQWWRRWSRFEWGTALFFVLLLAAEFFSLACDGYSPLSNSDMIGSPLVRSKIVGSTETVPPGKAVNRALSGQGSGQSLSQQGVASVGEGTVDLKWNPPSGASEVQFDPNYPPTNPDSGPPFVWQGLPLGAPIPVSYRSPQIPPGRAQWSALDLLATRLSGDTEWSSYAMMLLQITPSGQKQSRAAEPQNRPIVPKKLSPAVSEPEQTYHVWDVNLYIDAPVGQALTTDLCQTWADFWQQDTTFLAVRFPLLDPSPPANTSTLLPVVFYGDHLPTFKLQALSNPGVQDVFVAPLTYRTQYFAFLENMLPAVPDTHWLALGPATPVLTCPQGLNADGWFGLFTFGLDFGGEPDACQGCNLDHYFCYEGDEAPPYFPASLHLGANAVQPAYQENGITCVGPLSLLMLNNETPALALIESHMGQANPGEQVVFTHFLRSRSNTALDVTLTYTSTLNLPWSFYEMLNWDTPDFSKPITGTVTLPAMGQYWFTAVVDLPAEAEGMEQLSLDATSVQAPTLSAHTSDALWIGGWLTPPPPPPTATPTPTPTPQVVPLYMPVVLRS